MGGRLLKHARYYLVAPGGEPSDAAAVRSYGAADRGAVATGGLMYQIGGCQGLPPAGSPAPFPFDVPAVSPRPQRRRGIRDAIV